MNSAKYVRRWPSSRRCELLARKKMLYAPRVVHGAPWDSSFRTLYASLARTARSPMLREAGEAPGGVRAPEPHQTEINENWVLSRVKWVHWVLRQRSECWSA